MAKKKTRPTTGLLDQLRQHVRESDMLPIEIARRIGVSRSSLSKFLAGDASLRPANLDALAELLELKLCKRNT